MENVASPPGSVHLPFNGTTEGVPSVASVSTPLVAPEPRLTLDGDAVAAIERWAALQRTDLARLALALRSAEAAAARCEAEVAERSDGPPDEVLRVVDARLTKARQEAEDGVEAARRDAALVLSASRQHATTILTEAGIDPTTVLDAHDDEITPPPSRRLPVTAAQLWQQAEAAAPTARHHDASRRLGLGGCVCPPRSWGVTRLRVRPSRSTASRR